MTDVVLINCPIAFPEESEMCWDDTSCPPLGLLYLAACLEREGVSVKVVDARAQRMTLVRLLRLIEKERPRLVGLSALTFSTRTAVKLARLIRQRQGKDRPVIALGGPHLAADPEFFERFPLFDFGVTGEGELVFTKLVKSVLKGKKVVGIFNAQPIVELDKLPFPARHLVNKFDYYGESTENISKKEKMTTTYASLITSRGCPFACNFCSKPVHKNFYRFRSAENVFQEMVSIYDDYGGKYLLTDDTTTLNRQNTVELCQLIISSGKKFRWLAMTRANCVDRSLLKLMARSGCHDLFFGVESGNEKIRNEVIKKGVKNGEIARAVRWCREVGIQTNLFLMLGFPGETKEEIEETINFGSRVQADLIGIHVTLIMPGSELWFQSVREGRVGVGLIDRYAEGKMGVNFKNVWPHYVPDGLTEADLFRAKKTAYRHFYLDSDWWWRRLKRDLKSRERFMQDLRLVKTGLYTLYHGGTKQAMS